MEVRHFDKDETGRDIPHGIVGEDVPACRANDLVQVRARLTAPAYCYLLALHPNGQVQCYIPADDKTRPPRLSEIAYPADPGEGSPLADGTGLQAFVLLAFERSMPPYREWLDRVGTLPWRPSGPDAEGVWRFDGHTFERIDPLARSEPRKLVLPLQSAFDATCRFLAAQPEVRAIEARAFPVQPLVGPVGPAPIMVIEK
jgi:hypothetical protein